MVHHAVFIISLGRSLSRKNIRPPCSLSNFSNVGNRKNSTKCLKIRGRFIVPQCDWYSLPLTHILWFDQHPGGLRANHFALPIRNSYDRRFGIFHRQKRILQINRLISEYRDRKTRVGIYSLHHMFASHSSWLQLQLTSCAKCDCNTFAMFE